MPNNDWIEANRRYLLAALGCVRNAVRRAVDKTSSGGEPAALCLIDAVVRLLPGAISDHESASSDSHYDGLLSPPSYTRPAVVRGAPVPEVLLSGNHAAIAAWRQQEAERLTKERRPDLWTAFMATEHHDTGAKS